MSIRLDTPQNGQAIDWFGQRMRLPIRSSDTNGKISGQLSKAPPGFTNPPHVHTREDEIFFVIEGEIEILIADKKLRLQAGDLAFAPAGLPHQLTVIGPETAKLLVLLTGDTIEQAFIQASGGPSDDQKRIMSEVGVELLDHFSAEYRPSGFESVTSDKVVICRAGEGDSYWLAGDTYSILLSGDQTTDQLSIIHFDIPEGGGPVPHVHAHEFEAFILLDGEVELYADGTILTGTTNDVAILPPNIVHCFKNRKSNHARMLAVVAPAGFDRFIRNAGQPARKGESAPPVDDAEKLRLIATAPQFGITLRPDIHF
jgi:quercetin dioxygenase-like cupin family protein